MAHSDHFLMPLSLPPRIIACVISFQMKTATMQDNSSCKCLHFRHLAFETSFIDFYVDLQENSFDLLSKLNAIWPKFIRQCEL